MQLLVQDCGCLVQHVQCKLNCAAHMEMEMEGGSGVELLWLLVSHVWGMHICPVV